MKDDKAKNNTLLKDGLKELIELYPVFFSTFVKGELKQLRTNENIITKVVSRDFFGGFSFFKRYSNP